jgi:hypothetical protein
MSKLDGNHTFLFMMNDLQTILMIVGLHIFFSIIIYIAVEHFRKVKRY